MVSQSYESDGIAKIKVVGVGGGGCNAVSRMFRERIQGVEYVGVNTDAQALMRCEVPLRIRMGEKLTRDLALGETRKGARTLRRRPGRRCTRR